MGKSVLIVDDDEDDRYFLKNAISQLIPDLNVVCATDGCEAVTYLHSEKELPQLVFLDLNMTKMSGRETLMLIRNSLRMAKLPVIILTTSHNKTERSELMELGADAYYTKPFHQSDLLRIVSEIRNMWLGPQRFFARVRG
jgi:CheY-like chemotaxis protein